jgi:hypothetical protein
MRCAIVGGKLATRMRVACAKPCLSRETTMNVATMYFDDHSLVDEGLTLQEA